ncbi:putative ATP-dependint DNA ligase [Streptomyces azureus]|uniref:Putative ATP-dependint DNA ligase n=1 Tax=Streptomyces azureus TaxID=146537 RepID=A0A0K8PJH9_STRAJ|nr:putative ATP-dependint DNA ligase [Streptomyces azureus]
MGLFASRLAKSPRGCLPNPSPAESPSHRRSHLIRAAGGHVREGRYEPNLTLVERQLVVEVGVDAARDTSGRWPRTPAPRPPRPPTADVPRLTSPPP